MKTTTIILGRAGRDPEMRYTPQGKAVTNLSVAADVGYGDNKKTAWFRVTFWDRLAEVVNEYVTKGTTVYIEGELVPDEATGGPRIWTGQDGQARASLELTAQVVRFIGGRGDSMAGGGGGAAGGAAEMPVNEDDMPF